MLAYHVILRNNKENKNMFLHIFALNRKKLYKMWCNESKLLWIRAGRECTLPELEYSRLKFVDLHLKVKNS